MSPVQPVIKSPTCCMDMDIALIDLLFPERMSADGQEFCKVHGIGHEQLNTLRSNAIDLGNGMVKIKHRCARLADDGSCNIYPVRPAICRRFDCATRTDCECAGTGVIYHDLNVEPENA